MSIAQQSSSYRRGVVLGLTMAEIVTLVLFCLLLALAAMVQAQETRIAEQSREIEKLNQATLVDPDELKAVRDLVQYWRKFGPKEVAFKAYFSDLVMQAQQLDRLRQEMTQLVEKTKRLETEISEARLREREQREEAAKVAPLRQEMASMREKLDSAQAQANALVEMMASAGIDAGSPDAAQRLAQAEAALRVLDKEAGDKGRGEDLTRRLAEAADLSYENGNLRGQVQELKNRLSAEGKGGVLPSCWTFPDGRPDYPFEVKLKSSGLVVRKRAAATRAQEFAALPAGGMVFERDIAPQDFLAQTRALYEWSVSHDCRFYVVTYDATAAYEKDAYKRRMQAVEGHFYKLESRSEAPF